MKTKAAAVISCLLLLAMCWISVPNMVFASEDSLISESTDTEEVIKEQEEDPAAAEMEAAGTGDETLQDTAGETSSEDSQAAEETIEGSGSESEQDAEDSSSVSDGSEEEETEEEAAAEPVQVMESENGKIVTAVTDLEASYLRVAIWSRENAQDDIFWTRMQQMEDGTWFLKIDTTKLQHSGTCFAHVYTNNNIFVGSATFTVSEEEISRTTVEITGSGSTRTASAVLADEISASGVNVAVWSQTGAQDDIKWYSLKKNSDGSYTGTVKISNLKHDGLCYAHFYTTDNQWVGGTTFVVDSSELPANSVQVSGSESGYTVTAVTADEASSLKVAVWSKTGAQDDIVWYTMKQQTDGSWVSAVNLKKLKNSGICYAHVYTNKNVWIGGAEFSVTEEEIPANVVSVTGSGKTRTAAAELVDSGISSVKVAVWSKTGAQDDIKWYNLSKKSETAWSAVIQITNLKHSGLCYAHFYTGKNVFLGGVTFEASEEDFPRNEVSVTGSGSTRTITVSTADSSVKSVKAAVWSTVNGQDDIKWYTLKKKSDGSFQGNLLLTNLKHAGSVAVHCYTGSNVFVGAASFTIVSSAVDTGTEQENQTIRLISHRGYNAEAPENTLSAYELSKEMGYEYVETDVAFTSDGVAVLLHDSTVDRTSDGTGAISNLTYEEVSQLDFGSWKSSEYEGEKIPTLEEFLQLCKNTGLKAYVEIKSDIVYTVSQVQSIIQMVEAQNMLADNTFISFNHSFLSYVKDYSPGSRLGMLFSSDITESLVSTAKSLLTGLNQVFFDVKYSSLTEENLLLAKQAQIPVEVWTVDDVNTAGSLNSYISGITTNRLTKDEIEAAAD